MRYPMVSIIILNYNGIFDTRNCLKTVLKTAYPNFEIILVDNGSKNNEAEKLSKMFKNKKIRFIRLAKNLGFSGGNNYAIKMLKSKYVALLNNDCEVTPKWLLPMVKNMEKDNSIAVVQPKIRWLKNKQYFDYSGACGGYIDNLGYPFTRGRIFDTREKDNGQYNAQADIVWASGAAMLIRTSTFRKIGLFDTRFFNYMEEIDLCMRILKKGMRVICNPQSLVYHKVASTAAKNIVKKRFWEHRNNLFLLFKHFPLPSLIIIIPIRIMLEYLSLIYYLYKKRSDYALSVLLSQLSLLFFIPSLVLERARLPQGKNNINNFLYKGSVVFDYFILKKRRFSKIIKP